MPPVAADVPVALPAVAQLKWVLMAAIENRLVVLHGGAVTRGVWTRCAEHLGVDDSEMSRIRARLHERFSVEQLVRYCVDIGVQITITAK